MFAQRDEERYSTPLHPDTIPRQQAFSEAPEAVPCSKTNEYKWWPSDGHDAPEVADGRNLDRICGLRKSSFWILVAAILLVVAAAVGGAVGGALGSKHGSKDSNSGGDSQAVSYVPTSTEAMDLFELTYNADQI
jgi:hypothetical protein